jgi:hypothetical protein
VLARRRKPPKPKPGIAIDNWLRALLIGLGIVLIGLGIAGWRWAPEHKKFAPAATGADATSNVSEPSETISTALIAAGVLAMLVGINGRKIASIKVGGDELSFAEAVSKAAAAKAKKKAASANLAAPKVDDAADIAAGTAFTKAIGDPYSVDLDSIADAAIDEARKG